MKILIIEDEYNLADAISSMLKSKKYSVEIGVNGDVLPFLGVGDTITVGYALENDVIKVLEVK